MDKKIKILNIARNIPVPGIEENDIILRILGAIKNKTNFDIDIWFPNEILPNIPFLKKRSKAIASLPSFFQSKTLDVYSLKYIRLPSLRFSYLLVNSFWIFNGKMVSSVRNYDLVHAHSLMPDGYIALQLKKKYKIPFIVTMRNGDLDKINKLDKSSKLYQKYLNVLSLADRIIVHNYAIDKFVRELGFLPVKIPHGIEHDIIDPFKNSIKKEIVIVSQFIKRKHIDWLINAFIEIDNREWQLKIVGDGYCRKKLEQLAENNKNIFFMGKVPRENVLNYLKEADIFVLTSDNETFGLVYLEAVAKSCAVIAKRYTGIYGWLKEDREVLFADSKEELVEKMAKLMRDENFRIALARSAYNKVVSDFTWEKQISKYIDQYKALSS